MSALLRRCAVAAIASAKRRIVAASFALSSGSPFRFPNSSSRRTLLSSASLLVASGSAYVIAPSVLSAEQQHISSGEATAEVRPPSVPQAFIEELRAACGLEGVVLEDDQRLLHSRPVTSFHPVMDIPDVVVYPRSQQEVVAVVKACNTFKVPIIAFGGGTSLEGQMLTLRGGVSIDMNLMKKVKELHVKDMDVVVEPGIGWIELNEYLKPYELFFPLDPGPGASIGGMCATRCSGSLAVRYGNMKDNVVALKAIIANGDVIKTANRAHKTAAGYDLTCLMIGSEGTLGIITEVTLRLQKIPEASIAVVYSFPTVKDAADVAIAAMHTGIQISRLELLDEVMMKALNYANGKSFPESPTLMFEFIGTDAYVREQNLRVEEIAKAHKGQRFVFAESSMERDELWRMRKEILWACLSMSPHPDAITTDICVPISRLAECISRSKEETDRSLLTCATLAHAGDGNFHTVILFDSSKEDEVEEAKRLTALMVDLALEMEGTCTGEHGIGVSKMKYLEKELGVDTLRTMKSIKQALDPNEILNPGKIIPPHICA